MRCRVCLFFCYCRYARPWRSKKKCFYNLTWARACRWNLALGMRRRVQSVRKRDLTIFWFDCGGEGEMWNADFVGFSPSFSALRTQAVDVDFRRKSERKKHERRRREKRRKMSKNSRVKGRKQSSAAGELLLSVGNENKHNSCLGWKLIKTQVFTQLTALREFLALSLRKNPSQKHLFRAANRFVLPPKSCTVLFACFWEFSIFLSRPATTKKYDFFAWLLPFHLWQWWAMRNQQKKGRKEKLN